MKKESRPVLSILVSSVGLGLVCAIWVAPFMATRPATGYVQDWYMIAAKLTVAGVLSGLGFWLVALVIDHPVLVQRIRIAYRTLAILILNTLVLFACFEVAAKGIAKTWSVFSKPTQQLVGEGKPREKVSYYSTQDWAERYWYEFRLSHALRYYPYAGWRRSPFKGQTIQVDQNGLRVTPGADCSAKSFRVFTFGESTMWGTGSPDWGTIPANLQKRLEKLKQGPVCVMNFAEAAYATTQDVIMLQTQLRSGNVPDIVLFFNLSGDIGAAYQSGRADVHANFDDIAARFEMRQKPFSFVDQLRRTSAYSLIDPLVAKLTIADPRYKSPAPRELVTYESRGIDVAQLTELVVQDFLGNYNIVDGLAQKYGFKYFFFLPPVVVLGNKSLTSEEQEMKLTLERNVALYKLLTAVYPTVERESSKYRHIHSLLHVFDRYQSLVWIDEGHVTPIGNQLITEKMLDVMHVSAH